MLWPRRRRRTHEDFSEEIEAHLALEAQRLMDEGMTPEEARAAARRTFGSVTSAKERFYESGRLLWIDHMMQDLRSAARSLAKYPVACAVAVASLAGGIGATTATLTVRDVVFRKPPALYHAPEQLSRVQVGTPERPIRPLGSLVPGMLAVFWRDAALGYAVAASTPARVRDVRTADRVEPVPVRAVTPELFSVLGVSAALGRTFSELPRESTGPTPAVLSHRLWQTLLDGRPDPAGSVIWIDNQPHVVVGVMPERFWFSSMDSPIWTPLEAVAARSETGLEVVVRRPPGVTPQLLAQQLQSGLNEYVSRLPAGERQLALAVSGVEGTPLGHSVALVLPWLLSASVLLTLLIACANVAILVIAQWTAREHEIAIRASLGASRGRIVRLLLTESVLIAAVGGLLGLCATVALRGLIVRNAGVAVRFFDLSIDPSILIQAVFIALLTGVVAGIGPALLETRRLHGNPMRTMSSSDRVRQRWRHSLVVLEITVTVALLVVATTMLDGYRRHLTFDLGFRTQPLLTMRVENNGGVPIARILAVLKQMPGVAGAAAGTTVPFAAFGSLQRAATDAAGSHAVMVERGAISPDFFSTLDVPLRAGRAFTGQDSETSRTAIVSETLAELLFPGRDPIGSVWIGQTGYDIVGVAANYSNSAFQATDRERKLYLPLAESRTETRRVQFLVRATSDPVAVARAARREVRDAAAGNVVTNAFTLDQVIAVGGQEILVGTAPLVPLIATGLLLTAAGVYGVLAFAITRRSKELAVRVAIGATGRDLIRLVTAHSLRLIALGTVCGVGGTFALTRVARAAGGGGSMFDPDWPAFVVPVLIIVGIGALATWIPSRRAVRINPAVLLRAS